MNTFDRLFRDVFEGEPVEDLEKLAASITSIDIEDVTKESASKRQGEAFAQGFINALRKAGIDPKDAVTLLKVANQNVPEVGEGSTQPNVNSKEDTAPAKHIDPSVQNPTNIDEEPAPNPVKGNPMTETFDQNDLGELVSALGTSQDPTKQTGQATGPVKVEPEKEIAKKVVEIANGLIANGVDKDVAIEAAKAAVTAPETKVTREVAKQEVAQAEAQAQPGIEEALDVLSEALVEPVVGAAMGEEIPEEEGKEEAAPEEAVQQMAKAAADLMQNELVSNPYLLPFLTGMVPPIDPYTVGIYDDPFLKEAAWGLDPLTEALAEEALLNELYGPYLW